MPCPYATTRQHSSSLQAVSRKVQPIFLLKIAHGAIATPLAVFAVIASGGGAIGIENLSQYATTLNPSLIKFSNFFLIDKLFKQAKKSLDCTAFIGGMEKQDT